MGNPGPHDSGKNRANSTLKQPGKFVRGNAVDLYSKVLGSNTVRKTIILTETLNSVFISLQVNDMITQNPFP